MTNTDKTVSTERLAKKLDALAAHFEAACHVGDAYMVEESASDAKTLRDASAALRSLASRTQSPAEWQERLSRLEAIIHEMAGDVTPGGPEDRAWAEINALRAASITPPAPERSKEEVGVDRLLAALNWALGCADDFRLREEGEGAYWWRKELAERAGLVFDKGTYRLSALEPASLHKGEAVAWLHVLHKEQGETEEVVSVEMSHEDVFGVQGRDYDPSFFATSTPLYASPAPLPVTVTPDPAFLHGVCDSLRAAISEYEDRGLYPGARKIMQAQIDTLTSALSKPGDSA